MRRKIAIFLVISMIFNGIMQYMTWDISAEETVITMTEFYESEETVARDKVITISSKEELKLFRTYVEEGNSTSGGTFRLTQDIYWSEYEFEYHEETDRIGIYLEEELKGTVELETLNFYADFTSQETLKYDNLPFEGESWYGIGTSSTYMRGNFDGNGHTIYGLWAVKNDTDKVCALFGNMVGEIKNLSIKSCFFYNTEQNEMATICCSSQGNIINCNVDNTFLLDKDSNVYMGGILAQAASDIVVSDCSVNVFMSSIGEGGACGGIVATSNCKIQLENNIARGIIKGTYLQNAGGILAYAHTTDNDNWLSNCENYMDIEGKFRYVGGVVGDFSLYTPIKIENCINYGNITSKGCSGAGGIAGRIMSEGNPTEIDDMVQGCVNKGNVQGYGKCGGIVGLRDDAGNLVIKNCKNEGNIKSFFSYEDEGREVFDAAGGILGGIEYVTVDFNKDYQTQVKNCVNTGDISTIYGYCGGIVGEDCAERNILILENCYNNGSTTTEKGILGSLVGAFDTGVMDYCYYLLGTTENAIGEKKSTTGTQMVENLYAVTASQILGTEAVNKIGTTGYAAVYTLCEALNQWVMYQEEEVYYGWEDTTNGPMWKLGYYIPTPTPTAKPTATPTVKPTIKPTVRPTVTPTAESGTTEIPDVALRPTLTPTISPSVEPTISPTSSVQPKIKKKKMKAPTFSVKRKKTQSGIRYVQIRIKKYKGIHVQIWVKKKNNKKFYRLILKNNNIRKMKKVFNFQYKKQKGTMVFIIRTYKKQGKKKKYSYYSKKKRIRLS